MFEINNMTEQKDWYVYILECQDGNYYTGVSNDIEKRMKVHKSGKGSKCVRQKGFSHLIAKKKCGNKSDAFKAEYWIKKRPRNEKLDFFR